MNYRKPDISIHLPLHTYSESNRRDHWAVKAKRVKMQRQAVALVCRSAGVPTQKYYQLFTITITLIRLAPRQLDSDNLASSFKAIRDGIADVLGLPDNDSRIKWEYRQQKAKEYGVDIQIEGTPIRIEKGRAKSWSGLSDKYHSGKEHKGE